ncbi:type II secretion system protein [Candidatus Saccharibacteria bacterium]|nr:type II secretion system protein [Candidatus Saccharibacteria bacterium]
MPKLFTVYRLPFTIRPPFTVHRLQPTVNSKHTENRKPKTEKGFTLLEILLYLAIFAVTIGSIVGLSQAAISQRIKNQVIAEVNYQGEAVLASLSQAIRSAASVTSPALGESSASLTLATAAGSTNPTIFQAITDSGRTRLRLSEGSPASSYFLTNSHVRLSNLSFVNAGADGTAGSIKIQFDLSYESDSPRHEYVFSKTYWGATNLK